MCKLHRLGVSRRGQAISKWEVKLSFKDIVRTVRKLTESNRKRIIRNKSECHFQTTEEYGQDLAYVMQIGHFFSKALMYYRFGVNGMPQNKMFFESVEIDTILRKAPTDPGVTPSNPNPLPHIWIKSKDTPENKYNGQEGNSSTLAIINASDCKPSERVLELLRKTIF